VAVMFAPIIAVIARIGRSRSDARWLGGNRIVLVHV
jgi:hypothetical protein